MFVPDELLRKPDLKTNISSSLRAIAHYLAKKREEINHRDTEAQRRRGTQKVAVRVARRLGKPDRATP